LSSLVNQVNGSGTVWAVLDPAYTRLAMQQLVPETSQFPAAAQLTSKLKAMTISMKGGSGVDATFEAVCGSPEDANTFAALLTAGLMYRKYQVGNTNPELGQLLDSAQITPSGDRLDLKLSLTDDQMLTLIRKNTFAVTM
jgi:threonine dehydrogenase-like Zn-dependent dehydrogenase